MFKLQEQSEKLASKNQLEFLKEETKLAKIQAESDKLALTHAQKMELNVQRSQLSVCANEYKMIHSSNAKLKTKVDMNNMSMLRYNMYAAGYGTGSGGMQGKNCYTNNSLFCASV